MALLKRMQALLVHQWVLTVRMKPIKHRTPPATVRFLSEGVSRCQISAYSDMLVLLLKQLPRSCW
jgi:hypothetical protein